MVAGAEYFVSSALIAEETPEVELDAEAELGDGSLELELDVPPHAAVPTAATARQAASRHLTRERC